MKFFVILQVKAVKYMIKNHIEEDSRQQGRLHRVSQFLKCNENKARLLELLVV